MFFGQVPNSGNVFNVPKYQSLKIGEGTGTFTLTGTSTEIKLTYPDGTKASDYSALVAQITPEGANGTYTDIDSRSDGFAHCGKSGLYGFRGWENLYGV